MKIIMRKDAKAAGLTKYFTGKPCKRGHIDQRRVAGGICDECSRENMASPKKKAYDRKRYQENAPEIIGRVRAYSEANPKATLLRIAKWQAANPEKVSGYKLNNKYARRAAEASGLSGAQLNRWKDEQAKVCYWCGDKCPNSYHVDHYEPLSKGGKHEEDNLVIACPSCNLRKSAKDPYRFANECGRLF